MTLISDLPMDLLKEIVSRLPLKYMRAVRLTCKKWNTLSKSRSFSKMHIAKTTTLKEGESRMVVMMDFKLYLMSVVFIDDEPSTEFKGKLTFLNDSDQIRISQIYHCEGLLLCILRDDTRFVVWNPYCGQTRWIEPRYSHRSSNGWDEFSYALGYEDKKSCRSNKFLRFIDVNLHPHVHESHFLWYEIYDFDSGLWTTLDVTPQWRILTYHRGFGVSLKGNTYWCASDSNSVDELDDHMICFDFTSERFGPLLRFPFDAGYDDYVTLSCVREEKLAVLLQHNEVNPYEVDIWITTNIETEKVSWSKFLTVDMEPNNPITSGCFFIDEEKKVFMGIGEYDRQKFTITGEAGYFREVLDLVEQFDQNYRAHACSYVPSLAQIKQPSGGKRKTQSDLEKLRFDQNMLRFVEKRAKE